MIWLQEVEIHGFGIFKEVKINFSKGLNFIVGDNESGKSTLHTAILAILFGLRNVNSYRRTDATDFRGRILWKSNNEELEIERSFSDDHIVATRIGKNNSSFSGKVSPMGRSQDRAAYFEILKSWFGLEDELLFKSSVFVEQDALQVEPNKDAGEQLSRLITGSEELPYEEIKSKLLDRFFVITQKNPEGVDKRQPRELEKVSEEITQTERALTEAEAIEIEYADRKRNLEKTDIILDQIDIASQKRRLKTESIAIDSEIALLDEQLETRESIEERIGGINEWRIHSNVLIPSIGAIVATIGGMLLGFFWPSLILITIVFFYVSTKWFKNYNMQRELRLRLEGQLELLKTRDVLEISLKESREKLKVLQGEFDCIKETPFDDMPEAQRRKKENEVRRQRLELSERLAILTQRMRSPESLRDHLNELLQRKDNLKSLSDAIYEGYKMLVEATSDFKQESFERLTSLSSEHFVSLTKGLYKSINLDDDWVPMAVTAAEQTREFSTLSSGTRDSLLLSIRIAFGQLLSKDKNLPIILDDPMIYMDQERRTLFLTRLRPLANEHQIIIFTFDRGLGKKEEISLDLNLLSNG